MDGSEIGLFGTLRLMKRTTDEQVAAFPIDEEIVTFGREPTCSVRLYYPEISPLHAKIVFQERKAFLVVLGDTGLTIDGCPVLPSTNATLPTTVPVSNNCEIEIHKKRFIFSYPPKQLRSPLYNIDSPVKSENGGGGRRKIRMSMIHSAQVFTPRGKPSSDPLANLRILQSPLKQLVPSPRKPSALKDSHIPEPDEIEEEIVLVESNTPHVVQEDKDLVILERVDVQALPPPTPLQRPRPSINIYKTPNRRTRPSLHRAVLIRSVHRAVMAREEEEEEKEVEEVIVGEAAVEEGKGHENDDNEEFNDEHKGSAGDKHEESDEDGGGANSDTIEEPTPQPSTWRKSLNAVRARVVWPFRSSSTAPEENDDSDQEDEDEDDHAQMDTDEDTQPPPPSSSPPPAYITPQAQPRLTPARGPRPLGSFMTPQVSHPQSDIGIGRATGRNSLGGALRIPLPPGVSARAPSGPVETWGGAKRVRVEPKWRIGDIEVRDVEEVKEEDKAGAGLMRTRVSEEEKKVGKRYKGADRGSFGITSPCAWITVIQGIYMRHIFCFVSSSLLTFFSCGISLSMTRLPTNHNPQAIQERRKSALTTPDPFFAQVPGLRRQSVAPSIPSTSSGGDTLRKLPSLLDSAVRTVGERSISPTKSGERSISPTKFGERSTSPTKFRERSASPTKAPTHSRPSSPTKLFSSPVKSLEAPAKVYTPFGRPPSPLKAPLTPHSEEDEEDTRSLLDRMKRTVEEMKRRRSVGPFGEDEREYEEDGEDDNIAGAEQRMDVEENVEENIEEEQQIGEEEESSDKENGLASSFREPQSSSHPEPDLETIDPSEHMSVPLSPTRIALDLDLELERTPLPQLTRPTSRPQHKNAPSFAGPQTPALASLKHLFPPPAPVPSTPAVKSMRSLFRGAGKGAGMDMEEDVLEGVGEMMVTPEGYRAHVEDVDEQGDEIKGEEQVNRRETEERRKPPKTTSRKAPVPASGPGPTTTAARRRTRTTTATGATTSRERESSTSRTVSRVETVLTKRVPILPPKRTEKEKERAKMPEPAPKPVAKSDAEDEAKGDEIQEIPPQPAAQKKPARARLLRARKGVAADDSDEEPAPVPKTRDTSTEPRMRAASTEPGARVVATTARKTKVDAVEMIPKTRATRSRSIPVPVARSEPAKARPRVLVKPKAATTTTRAPSRGTMRSTEDNDDDDGDDPLDSIAKPEAPAPIQRARRTRAVTAPVKEEDVDVPVPGKAKNTTTTRRRAMMAVDKENTPSSSKEDEGERKKEVEVKRTTRATRSRT
ncbi:hypothetical protein BDR07DRAFT_450202 [Suillus spraguei]|nr:hypothetical protein BDR07DRAFT_450202 [Suillus spraguei]